MVLVHAVPEDSMGQLVSITIIINHLSVLIKILVYLITADYEAWTYKRVPH